MLLYTFFSADVKLIFSSGYSESVTLFNKANGIVIIGLYKTPYLRKIQFRKYTKNE